MFTLGSRENPRQDPFAEEDFEGHAQLTAIVGDKAVQMSIFHQSLGVLPSGKLTVCYWKWPFIVSFPIKNGDFP